MLKIVPDVILKELKKGTNINFETDTYKDLRDVVTTIVHNLTNTTMPMDIEKRLLSVTEGGGAGGDDDERKEHNESQDNKIENEGDHLNDENGGFVCFIGKGAGGGWQVEAKGKGKANERACYNCGRVGHLAKDCWQPKGKGKSKGDGKNGGWYGKGKFGKGDYGKGDYGKGKGLNYVDQDQSRAFAPQPQPVQNQANYNHSNQLMVASWNGNSGGYGGLNLCTLTTSNRFHKLSTDDDEVDEHARDNSVDKNEAEMKSCGKVANTYTFGDVLQKAIKDRNELKQNKKWSTHDRKKHDRFRRRDNDEIEKAATQKENMVTHDFKEQPKYTIACLTSATKLDIAEQHLCVNAVEDDYEKVSIMIDSGASETVAPAECFESYDLVKTTASGTTYASAAASDGNEIVNIGDKFVEVVDENGTTTWAKFQVCRGLGKVNVLGSVSRLVQAGHRVVFQSPELGSYIENVVNGYRTYLRQSNGSYFLDMWVRRKVNDNSNNSGFPRPGM